MNSACSVPSDSSRAPPESRLERTTMSHAIQGLIVHMAIAKTISVEHAIAIPLNTPGLTFIPMTDALFDHLAALFSSATGLAPTEFWKLSASGALWIEELSAIGRVAYVETD